MTINIECKSNSFFPRLLFFHIMIGITRKYNHCTISSLIFGVVVREMGRVFMIPVINHTRDIPVA